MPDRDDVPEQDISNKPQKDVVAQRQSSLSARAARSSSTAAPPCWSLQDHTGYVHQRDDQRTGHRPCHCREDPTSRDIVRRRAQPQKASSVFGYSALEMLSKLNVDVAFISASGYSREGGFTCGYEEQAKLRRLLIEKARCVIILMDSSKVGKMLPYTFAKMEDVDYLVTDQAGVPQLSEDARHSRVSIL